MTLPNTTVRYLVTKILRKAGILADGEEPTASEAQDTLDALNDLLDTWNIEQLMIYSVIPQVFPLTPSQVSYTMGPGGDFNVPRPVRIEDAYTRDQYNNDYPIAILDQELYSQIITKQVASPLPQYIYPDGNFPLQNIYVYPVPNDPSYSLVLWTWQPLPEFQSLDDVLIFPPGYRRALIYNGAVEIGEDFGAPLTERVIAIAKSSKAQIKKINFTVPVLAYAGALTAKGRAYNYLTGQ